MSLLHELAEASKHEPVDRRNDEWTGTRMMIDRLTRDMCSSERATFLWGFRLGLARAVEMLERKQDV